MTNGEAAATKPEVSATRRKHRKQNRHGNIEHSDGDEHTLDAGRIFERLFRLFRLIEQARQENKHGADYHARVLTADSAYDGADKRQRKRNRLAAIL